MELFKINFWAYNLTMSFWIIHRLYHVTIISNIWQCLAAWRVLTLTFTSPIIRCKVVSLFAPLLLKYGLYAHSYVYRWIFHTRIVFLYSLTHRIWHCINWLQLLMTRLLSLSVWDSTCFILKLRLIITWAGRINDLKHVFPLEPIKLSRRALKL